MPPAFLFTSIADAVLHPFHYPMQRGERAHLQEFWSAYLAAMDGAGYNRSTPVYVASGLLTYMSATGAIPRPMPLSASAILSG